MCLLYKCLIQLVFAKMITCSWNLTLFFIVFSEVYVDPNHSSYDALKFVSGVSTTFTPKVLNRWHMALCLRYLVLDARVWVNVCDAGGFEDNWVIHGRLQARLGAFVSERHRVSRRLVCGHFLHKCIIVYIFNPCPSCIIHWCFPDKFSPLLHFCKTRVLKKELK